MKNDYDFYSREGENLSGEGENQPSDPGEALPTEPGEIAASDGDTRPVNAVLNEEPFKRRIRLPMRRLARIARKVLGPVADRFTPAPPTPAEIAAMDEAQRLKKLGEVLKLDAKDCSTIMSHALARMGLCYKRVSPDGEIMIKRFVTFDFISLQEDALWFHVDMRKLPWGVSKNQLVNQDVVDDLSCSVGRRVGVKHDAEAGVWYVVERASGRMGIPAHVKIAEMWERMPQTATSMTIPVGMSNNRRLVYDNIADWPHGIVAGTTGMGKSNMVNVMLCTLIRRNTPERLRLALIDLKGGMEFSFYEGIPHLMPMGPLAPGGIVYERENVLPMLHFIHAEGEKRMKIIRDAGFKDIANYNAHKKKGMMPRILVVSDEWADIRLSSKGKETEEMLMNVVQRFRAVGIHFVICTQVPSRDVLSMPIRTNLPAKIAFSCADMAGSLAVLGNSEAFAIGVTGRAVYRSRAAQIVQTPFIPDSVVKETVRGAITGQFETLTARSHDVTLAEILDWALHENAAKLDVDGVYKHFRERGITQIEVQAELKAAENNECMIGSAMYRVEPGAGSRSRRLVAVEDDKDDDTDAQPTQAA